MAWRDRLLTPLIGHSKASAERTTRRYLEDINSASCLNHLDEALDQLLDGIEDVEKIFSNYATTNPSGKRLWNRDSFARYINARLPEIPAVTTCVSLAYHYSGALSPPAPAFLSRHGQTNQKSMSKRSGEHLHSLSHAVIAFRSQVRWPAFFHNHRKVLHRQGAATHPYCLQELEHSLAAIRDPVSGSAGIAPASRYQRSYCFDATHHEREYEPWTSYCSRWGV